MRQKFYVHRTNLAEVTEITEIEAHDMAEARSLVHDGEGTFIGLHVGDYSPLSTEQTEVFEAAPFNLPMPFYRADAAK